MNGKMQQSEGGLSGRPVEKIRQWLRPLWVGGAVVCAALLYSTHLRGDLYGDEWGHTHKVITSADFWKTLADPSMCHPPLYFVLAKLCYSTTGVLWAIRLPSLLSALGAVLLLGKATRELLGREYEILALWLGAFSPFLLEFAAEGRAYAMLMFFSAGTLWTFWRFLEHENRATTAALLAFCIGGAVTHYFFQFQLIALAAYYLLTRRRITRYSASAGLLVGTVTGILFVATFILQSAKFRDSLQVDWVARYFSVPNFLARLPIAVMFGYSTFWLEYLDPARNVPLRLVYHNALLLLPTTLSLLGIVVGWVLLLWRREKWAGLLTMAIAIPVLFGVAASVSGLYLIREKHLAVIWAPSLLLALRAFGLVRAWRVGWAAIGCYVVVCGVSILHFVFQPNEYSRREDWTGLRNELKARTRDGDIVMAYSQWTLRRPEFGWTVVPGLARKIDLRADRPANMSLKDFVHHTIHAAPGQVFFVCYGTDRHGADPEGVALTAMFRERKVMARRFGRGLTLYTAQGGS